MWNAGDLKAVFTLKEFSVARVLDSVWTRIIKHHSCCTISLQEIKDKKEKKRSQDPIFNELSWSHVWCLLAALSLLIEHLSVSGTVLRTEDTVGVNTGGPSLPELALQRGGGGNNKTEEGARTGVSGDPCYGEKPRAGGTERECGRHRCEWGAFPGKTFQMSARQPNIRLRAVSL